MLTATEFLEIDLTLKVVLWIEVIVYLGIGVYELLDDFVKKPKPWAKVNGRLNSWIVLQEHVGHKMHAALCFILGFIALNGVLEGQVTRFELELLFVSLALISGIIWGMLPPGRLAVVIPLTKPEVWLQIVMYLTCAPLVRTEIILLCVVLNAWGVVVYFAKHRRSLQPFTYAELRGHIGEVEGADTLARIDKMAGYTASGDIATADEHRGA